MVLVFSISRVQWLNITGGEVVLLLIKLTFLRYSWDLNIPLQSIFLTLNVIYITSRHVFLINHTFDSIHEHLINTYYMFLMFYIKYYMKELNIYFKQFKVSIRKFIIVTGCDTSELRRFHKTFLTESIYAYLATDISWTI